MITARSLWTDDRDLYRWAACRPVPVPYEPPRSSPTEPSPQQRAVAPDIARAIDARYYPIEKTSR